MADELNWLPEHLRESYAEAMVKKAVWEAESYQYAVQTRVAREGSRFYPFMTPIMDETVDTAMEVLSTWQRYDVNKPVQILLQSPGGIILSGFGFYDFLLDFAMRTPLIVEAGGYCASMAATVLQAGTTRAARANSRIMLHQASTFTQAKSTTSVAQMRDQIEELEALQRHLEEILVARAHSLTLERLQSETLKKDWWIPAPLALELGIIDRIFAPGERFVP